jgi:hypothetical protein
MTVLRIVIPLHYSLEHDLFRKPVPTFRDHTLTLRILSALTALAAVLAALAGLLGLLARLLLAALLPALLPALARLLLLLTRLLGRVLFVRVIHWERSWSPSRAKVERAP